MNRGAKLAYKFCACLSFPIRVSPRLPIVLPVNNLICEMSGGREGAGHRAGRKDLHHLQQSLGGLTEQKMIRGDLGIRDGKC